MSVHVDSLGEVGHIADQLRRSRRMAASGEIGSARVATVNLVVHVGDAERREWALERAARVAEKHPSRLVVLDESGATQGIDVSTNARQAMGATLISERVEVGIVGHDAATIKSVTQETTAHDIPTVLWWTGTSFVRNDVFDALAEIATSVLVDSSGPTLGDAALRELARLHEERHDLVLRDLAFMRLTPWQEMIAQFFDEPALRDDLFALRSLDVESGSQAEALYLAGWLGSRLSWTPAGDATFRRQDGEPVPVTTTLRGERRRVGSVTLRSDRSVFRAELAPDDENVVALTVDGSRAKPTWFVPLQNIDNASLIERVILDSARDEIFLTSLATAAALT